MKTPEIIQELSKLNFKTSLFFSNSSPIRFDDLLYIRTREGEVRSYTVLKLKAINFSSKSYELADEQGRVCTVERERICLYIGQNLKLQMVYDIITQAISIVLISVLLGLVKLFPKIWAYILD